MELAYLKDKIAELADGLGRVTLMEVCGTHTHNIRRFGLRQLLPQNIRLVSGPGCPVCVTAQRDIAAALALAEREDMILCCFGDMVRVPCGKRSLGNIRGDVRVCVSPMDALTTANENPDRQIVWFGVGFETTTPHTAALIEAAARDHVDNLTVLSAHKTMPEAIRALMRGKSGEGGVRVDGLICPGHVATVTGAEAFRFVPEELGLPAAVTGFEAEEIMAGIAALTAMLRRGKPGLVNAYPAAVRAGANEKAAALVGTVFRPCGAEWRGLGQIPDSGLCLREEYGRIDAQKRFGFAAESAEEPTKCRCADILRGLASPADCPLFGSVCTPEAPAGACMVSSEGACAAWYRYGGDYDGR